MSLITDYNNSNDNRKDLNTPKINVALPSTQGLKPADVSEVTGAVQPTPSPVVPQPAIAAPPPPVAPPQVETPEPFLQPGTEGSNTESVVVSPEPQQVPVQPVMTQDQQVDQFIKDTLNTDMSSVVKPENDLDAVKYDQVAGSQAGMQDIEAANIDTQTMLMMQGKSIASSIEDSYNMAEFQPSLYGGDSMPFFDDLAARGRATRAALGNNIIAEQQKIIEDSFQPKPLPQTETDPTKPRPDSTASFNRQWSSFFNSKLSPQNPFNPGKGQFGEAQNGLVGGLIYGLGLPQNLAFGMGLDVENFVQKSPLGGVYNKIGDTARWGLQQGLNAIGAFGNAVNERIGMGKVNTQLPKDFDPVRADPKFKGSYTMNALRGEQYSFSDASDGKNNPLGIRTEGNNPSFMIGMAGDILLDPAGFLIGALAPLKQGNRVVRTAGRAAEIAVDPIGEAVVPALGTVTTSIFRNKVPALPPASEIPTGKPPKKGAKKKASQAGVVPPSNKKPQTVNVKPNVDPAPPKGSPLRAAWEQKQAARKARAEAAKVKRVIIPSPPKGSAIHPDAAKPRVIVTPEPPTKLTVTTPGGRPAARAIPKPTPAQVAVENQSAKVQLEPLTPERVFNDTLAEAQTRPVSKLPGKKANLEAEVVNTAALPEGKPRPALPPAKDDISRAKLSARNTNQTDDIVNDVLVTPPPSAAKELMDAEVISRQLIDVGDGQVVEGVEAAKVAAQTLRRNEAELVRVASRQAVAESIAPSVKKATTSFETKPTFYFVDTKAITTVVDATPDERIVKEILEEGGLTQPLKLNEVGVEQYELADETQATLLASAQEAYRRDPRTAEMQNSFVYKKVREPKARVAAKEAVVVEAREVVESIPVEVQPSIIPTVTESVFKGEMTVSEVAEQIANFRPGDVVDASTIRKATRTLPDLTALMKLIPHPDTGKPLIAANRGSFKTYKDIEEYLLKEGIEDPSYFRMLAREGAPIPAEALNGSAFKVVTNKPRPFNATPATVVDNTVARVIAGQLELPGQLPGVKLDTSVKVSFDPSIIRPVSEANKTQDFRGSLNKQRTDLRKSLDEVESPEEMEKILERIADIDEELATPNLKRNPGHLQQLQDEVIPDTQHGIEAETIRLTETKIQLEQELTDASSNVRLLEVELGKQEKLLEQAANRVVENTADIGRKELDDDYVPVIEKDGVPTRLFETTERVEKKVYRGNSIYWGKDTPEFAEENISLLMRALDLVDAPPSTIVLLSDDTIESMRYGYKLDVVKNIGTEEEVVAFVNWETQNLYLTKELFDRQYFATPQDVVDAITHELGHKVGFRKAEPDFYMMHEDVNTNILREKHLTAMEKDGGDVSRYSASFRNEGDPSAYADEDFAESVREYVSRPYYFAEKFPRRAYSVAEELESSAAELLNKKTFYHGTRTTNWEPTADPLTTEARNVWGQGTYLYSDVTRAVDEAQAELAVNTPDLVRKEVDMAGTVYEVKPNFERVLRADSKVTPSIQKIFSDAIEDVLGRKTPETRKALRHFVHATSPKVLEDGTTKYPRQTVKELYGVMEKYVHKYLGVSGMTIPEEQLSDLYRAVNSKMRESGYDAIFDKDLVVVLKPQRITAINKETLSETDQLDVLVSRYNVDSQLASHNPGSPSAQVNMMESGVRLQKEMVEQTRAKLEVARNEQLQKLQQYQELDDKLTEVAKKEQDTARLNKRREGEANEEALNKRLSKPNTNHCSF